MGGQIAYYPTLKREFGAAMTQRYPKQEVQV
jgi:3-oxoacyl-[acyl-carrier protein] reductase